MSLIWASSLAVVLTVTGTEADTLLPLDYRVLVPPDRGPASVWIEAESGHTNFSRRVRDDAYGGEHLALLTDEAPGQEGYFLEVSFEVSEPGRYRLLVAGGPPGLGHISPTRVELDGQPIDVPSLAPHGPTGWGESNASQWTGMGWLDLDRGAHRLRFIVTTPRPIGRFYAQQFDAIALVHDKDLKPNVTFVPPAPRDWTARAGEAIEVPLTLTIAENNLKSSRVQVGTLRLTRRGETVAEAPFTLALQPGEAGEEIGAQPSLEIPFDAPSGAYKLILGGFVFPDAVELGDIAIEGRHPRAEPADALLSRPALEASSTAQAGADWSFALTCVPVQDIASPPQRVVVRLALSDDRVMLAESFVVAPQPWRAGETVELGPFTLALPSDLPAGDYAVHARPVGQAFVDRMPADDTVGRVAIESDIAWPDTQHRVRSSGTFVDSRGQAHVWYATPENTLYWNGEPQLQVSGMYAGHYLCYDQSPEALASFLADVRTIKAHGITHIYLSSQGTMASRPAYSWSLVSQIMEDEGMTYVLGFNSGVPSAYPGPIPARPIRAAPNLAWQVTDIPESGDVQVELTRASLGAPGTSVYGCDALLLDSKGRPLQLVEAELSDTSEDRVVASAHFSDTRGAGRVLFLPALMETTHSNGNPWENWEGRAEAITAYLDQLELGPGFRGFIDMSMPNERGIYNAGESMFFESDEFRADRVEFLRGRYETLGTLASAWGMLDDAPPSFEAAARLFPAWWPQADDETPRPHALLVDPESRTVYSLDPRRSVFWLEYIEHRDKSYAEFQTRMIDRVRAQMDAPILMKRVGVPERYQANTYRTDRGLDGNGYEIYASGEGLVSYGAGSGYAEMLQSGKTVFGAATEFNRGFGNDMPANWPDLPAFFYDLAVAQHLNAKGLYLFLFNVLPDNYLTSNRLIEDSRMLEWMGLWQQIVNDRAEAVALHQPLVYTSWPSPDAWWARPSERVAVQTVDGSPGLMPTKARNGIWVLPVFDPLAPAPLTIVTLADIPDTLNYREQLAQLLKADDREIVFLGLRRDLGSLPIDKLYTSEVFVHDGDLCQKLRPEAGWQVLEKDPKGRVWAMRKGRFQIVARRPWGGSSIESSLAYVQVPQVTPTARLDAAQYLRQLMGVKVLSLNKGQFKGVAYTLDGDPWIAIHTTSRTGGETLTLPIPPDRRVTAILPDGEQRDLDGESDQQLTVTFPPGPGDDPRRGAGAGLLRVRGLEPGDLVLLLDAEGSGGDSGLPNGAVALPDGIDLPPVMVPPLVDDQFIDHVKAAAALEQAANEYRQGKLDQADSLVSEWLPLAPEELMPTFHLLQGHLAIRRGDPVLAERSYRMGLNAAADHAGLRCGLGVSLYIQGDHVGAAEAWSAVAGTSDAARSNLRALED